MEEIKETETEQKENEENTSVDELIKNYLEKEKQMQAEFEKKLADKDEIIKQLVMGSGKNEPELTDDDKSCLNIIKNINKRR